MYSTYREMKGILFAKKYIFVKNEETMTAIVGVLNKHGVALAADSAVTFGNTHKVVNTGNKVFALSKYHPVAVATYGRSAFMGTPWDIIIKLYRQKLGKQSFPKISEYVDSFIKYLHDESFFAEVTTQHRFLRDNIQDFYNKVERQAKESPDYKEDDASSFVLKKLSECLSLNKSATALLCPEFVDYKLSEFKAFASTELNEVLSSKPYLTENEHKELFIESYFYYLRIVLETIDSTGLVFFGYGDKEIYPSLYPLTVSFGIGDRLHYFLSQPTIIQENGTVASVIPFAQIDVSQTIIRGINPSFYKVLAATFKDSLSGFVNQVATIIKPINDAASDAILKLNLDAITDNYIKSAQEQFKENYTDALLDTIVLLDKEDMSNMAESFVSLTSLVRRMSPGEETVGGPVDVVFVSKGDGLIWMKRKHYFQPGLNNQFFANYFNEYRDDE